MKVRTIALYPILFLFVQQASAHSLDCDTLPHKWKTFPYRPVVSALLTAYGAVAEKEPALKDANRSVFNVLGKPQRRGPFDVDDFLPGIQVVGMYGLNVAGVKFEHRPLKVIVMHASSLILANAVVFAAKDWMPEWRPDSSNRLSFPSGHTANAFVTAEMIRREFNHISPWYGVAGYTMAAATGFLRMYNRKHWLSDVLAGAGIGVLATQLVYWVYPLQIKDSKVRKKRLNAFVMPVVGRSVGAALVVTPS